MTKTLVSIKLDSKIKKEAQRVAEELGLTLSAVMNAIIHEFVRTKELHVGLHKPREHMRKIVSRAKKIHKSGDQ